MTRRQPCAEALTALSLLAFSSAHRFGDRGGQPVLFVHDTI